MVTDDGVNCADGQLGSAGDGADGLAVDVTSDDDSVLVGVDNTGAASGAAATATSGCVEAAREEISADGEACQEVTADPLKFLYGEYVIDTQEVDCFGQRGAVSDGESTAGRFLEHLLADRVEPVVLPSGFLFARDDSHQSRQRLTVPGYVQ